MMLLQLAMWVAVGEWTEKVTMSARSRYIGLRDENLFCALESRCAYEILVARVQVCVLTEPGFVVAAV